MDKFWERYIQSRPAPGSSKGAFDAFAAAHRDPRPRTMAQEPRNMYAGGSRARLGGGKLAFDAARRAFLKTIGAGAGTAVAVKTGLIGLSKKAKVADDIKVFLRHETDLEYSRTHVDFLPLTKKGEKILKELKITDDSFLTAEDGLGVLDDIKKSTPNIHLEVMVPKGTKGAIINKGVHFDSSPTKIFRPGDKVDDVFKQSDDLTQDTFYGHPRDIWADEDAPDLIKEALTKKKMAEGGRTGFKDGHNVDKMKEMEDTLRYNYQKKLLKELDAGKKPSEIQSFKNYTKTQKEVDMNPSKKEFDKAIKEIEKVFKKRRIKLKKGEAGFITTDILKDIKKLGPKGLRLLSSEWVWPEIVIGWLDKKNNIQKGMSEERASSEMWKNMTFGLRDKGGTENAILGQLKKLGYGEDDQRAVENFMRYGKLSKEIEETEGGIKSMEEGYTPQSTEKGAQQLREKLENLKKEQESVAGFYFGAIGDKDANYGYELYDQASKELMRTE